MNRDSAQETQGGTIDERIRDLWGDRLEPVSAVPSQAPVTDATRLLLTRTGLPAECPLDVTLYRDERLLSPLAYDGAAYLVVGDDYGTTLALKADSGELWSVQPDGSSPARFVNSGLGAYVVLLGLYVHGSGLASLGDRKRKAAVAELGREMTSWDAAALGDDENWWSVILEQMADGLL